MTKKRKILVLEDNKDVRSIFLMILRGFGYDITGSEKSLDAVTKYKEALDINDPFDVILLDLTIPGDLRAPEVLKILKKLNPSVKAVITSGYVNDPEMTNFKDFGFVGAIPKPFMIEDLVALLDKITK